MTIKEQVAYAILNSRLFAFTTNAEREKLVNEILAIKFVAAHRSEILTATEFGYKCCEKGMNIQETIAKAEELM